MTNKIVVVGSCMIDFVSYAPRLPNAGETIHGHKFVTNFGGKGANQCVAAAKLGGSVSLVARVNTFPFFKCKCAFSKGFKVGDDVWGPKYISNLEAENVYTGYVKITENSSSGIAQINVADSGMNQIVIIAGANNKLMSDDIKEARSLISEAAVVVLQLETPVETAIVALRMAEGISILNGAPALSRYDDELLKLPSIFCVNEHEASVFTGLPVNNVGEAELAAKHLISKGCQSVLITLGAEGAIYLSKECNSPLIKVDSPVVKSIDSTGAGDAFIGALAFCLANNNCIPMEKAIKAACIVAADSVTRLGTQASFPGPEILQQVEAVL